MDVRVTFWENGFSVDDGPLRAEDDPASRDFMEQLKGGQIPAEILLAHRGRRCDIHLVRRAEPYKAPPVVPFSTPGQRLGGPS